VYCLVMEKIDGIDLDQFIKQNGSIGERKALDWMRQLVEIVHYLHQKGIFHRDIKPSNLLLKPNGKIVLIDFGTVREITDTYLCKIGRGPNYVTEVNDITIVNSVSYSPFEQTQGKAVLQSDFYAIGRTFIYLLTGMSPLKFSQNAGQLDWRLSAHHVSQPFADFLNRMMSLLPIDRPRDTQEILTILQRLPGEIKRYKWLQSPWVKLVKFAIGVIIFLVFVKVMLWYFSERYLSFALKSASIGEFDKAEFYIKSAISYDSDNPKFHVDLAIICQNVGTISSNWCAIKHYEQALQLKPKNESEVRYNLGNLYEKIGDRKKAKIQFSEILKQDEKFINARNNLVQILILERQYASAEQLILPALSQSQDKVDRSVLLKNLGWLQFEQQQYVNASESLTQALKLNEPDRTDAHCLLAKVYDVIPNLGTATEHWRSCLFGTATTPEVKSWQQNKIRQLLKTEVKSTVPEPPPI
jgi:Tfp pilus assembly protein PilF